MKIALCGSTDFYPQMEEIKLKLRDMDIVAAHPSDKQDNDNFIDGAALKGDHSSVGQNAKYDFIIAHRDTIFVSDAILVVNLTKKGLENYIGGNTFLEMGIALAYDKKIFIYNNLPLYSDLIDELSGMKPFVLSGDLNRIKLYI